MFLPVGYPFSPCRCPASLVFLTSCCWQVHMFRCSSGEERVPSGACQITICFDLERPGPIGCHSGFSFCSAISLRLASLCLRDCRWFPAQVSHRDWPGIADGVFMACCSQDLCRCGLPPPLRGRGLSSCRLSRDPWAVLLPSAAAQGPVPAGSVRAGSHRGGGPSGRNTLISVYSPGSDLTSMPPRAPGRCRGLG